MNLFKKEKVPDKWMKIGLKTKEAIKENIEIAYYNKEQLDANIFIGKTKYGNICLCLDDDYKIINAFPVLIDKLEYIKIKQKIDEIGLGAPDEIHLQVVSLFFCIDVLNNKEKILEKINFLPQNFSFDLFECYIDKELTVISMELGKLVIGTRFIKEFVLNNSL